MIKTVSNINDIDIAGDIRRDINRALSEKKLQGVEEKALDKMDEIKNRQTRQGESPAKGGRWVNFYSKRYAENEKGRVTPVTLRKDGTNQRLRNSIEKTHTVNVKNGTELRFRSREAARIHWINHTGNYKGNKKPRQIYPENDKQVPKEIDTIVNREIFRLLNR